jgi:SAM-dependent methyltransferase
MKPLDIRDISIIDAFPCFEQDKRVLNVGCGEGRIDYHLNMLGYRVLATDYKAQYEFQECDGLEFRELDILRPETFPSPFPIVICSEVLEHLVEWRKALKNLIGLAETRLILTFPHRRSYGNTEPPPVGHCNFWDDRANGEFRDVNEFKGLCRPYVVSISRIRTKPRDVQMGQWDYLVVVDKRQCYE